MNIRHISHLAVRTACFVVITASLPLPHHPAAHAAQRDTGKPELVAVDPSQQPGAAWYAPGPLEIKVGGGVEFTTWETKTTLTQAMKTSFRWRPRTTDPLAAVWQLSSVPFKPEHSGANARGLIASGAVKVPGSGSWGHFDIDLTKHLPAQPGEQPRTYYVRVTALKNRQPFKALTGNVELTYKKYESTVTIHSPTIKEEHPGLYDSSPLTVSVDLNELYIGNENEGGDEPYLILAVIYADGTTINPLNFASSSVRVRSPQKAHGNVPDHDKYNHDLDTTKTAWIPDATGRFVESIIPIGLDLAADLEESAFPGLAESMAQNTKIHIMAVAMEEDGTSHAAAKAARDAAIQALQNQVNAIVQSMTLGGVLAGETPDFDPAQIQSEIESKALKAAENATLSGPWFMAPFFTLLIDDLDRDDYVGSGTIAFTYAQILSAGSDGIKFDIPLANSADWEGSYTLRGVIRRE